MLPSSIDSHKDSISENEGLGVSSTQTLLLRIIGARDIPALPNFGFPPIKIDTESFEISRKFLTSSITGSRSPFIVPINTKSGR